MNFTTSPKLGRRSFLRVGLTTFAGFQLLPMARPLNVEAQEKAKVRGGAEYCIFLFQDGGAPQLDTWDLKEGRWTPPDFDVRTVKPGILWPYGQFPRLAQLLDRVALARSMQAWESAHARAQYYMQVGHILSPARVSEMPAVGAVVSYELQSRRKESDFLPPFVAINFGVGKVNSMLREGCLPDACGPLSLTMGQAVPFVISEEEKGMFNRRWELLQALENSGRSGLAAFRKFESFYSATHSMMTSSKLEQMLALPEEDRKRYGNSSFGDGCLLARKLVEAQAGTRYIIVSQGGWDLHANMYSPETKPNHYTLCGEFDSAVSALFADLEQTKAADGRSLLDKTFILSMGEFGRTGGDLTPNKGRDHNQNGMTALFAGGGVKGGQVFGATDEKGARVVRTEWDQDRSIYPEDVIATIYSVLGIDWTKKITNTPSGRAFQYIESASGTDFVNFGEISRLFT